MAELGVLQRAFHSSFPTYVNLLNRELRGCKSVLDLGCGSGSPLKYVKKTFYSVGVDTYWPSIEKSRKAGIHDKYVKEKVLNVRFKEGSFDCVVALDLIEHLDKKDGHRLIRLMDRIASKKVVIFTPNGFLKQDAVEGNPYQLHKSGWSAEEMKTLGFDVYGLNGIKSIRGEQARIKRRPKLFWEAVSMATQPFVFRRPKHAFQIFCVKRKDI
jgi:SAM-dependent methyltransferase